MGASIRPATLAGLDRCSSEIAADVACPAWAACWYIAQMLGRNRPQSTCWRTAAADPAGLASGPAGPAAELAGPGSGVPNPAEPWVNSSPAHCLANTPLAGPPRPVAGPPPAQLAGPPPA